MAIMKNENWAALPKLHAGGDDKLRIEFAWPYDSAGYVLHNNSRNGSHATKAILQRLNTHGWGTKQSCTMSRAIQL